ncbi:MAG: hypothetical protein ACLFUI_08535 [Halanaerobiales bacterium]
MGKLKWNNQDQKENAIELVYDYLKAGNIYIKKIGVYNEHQDITNENGSLLTAHTGHREITFYIYDSELDNIADKYEEVEDANNQ